jgi:signal transduction histidine kinase
MYLLQISIEMRIFIGIAAMALLFTAFIISFVTSQRKKLEYHHKMQEVLRQKQELLARQNETLELMVEDRTAELHKQKEALQGSLLDLKNTQAQLVQSEKMASLGEMTAGIAHEIKNPLNFINNFSEVSIELFEELEEELKHQNMEEVKNLSGMLKENLQKIQHHSGRADKIVKTMLEHSRTGTGKKILININDLANEALDLSYHSMVVKHDQRNIKTEFSSDPLVPPVLIASQEMSRVIVNLCNNSFYSVIQKWKKQKIPDYEPMVKIETKLAGRNVLISVIDNGTGIPENQLEKIFQPFYTTKPAGDGTGLGLSLSYEIVNKMHGGKIEVVSEEDIGATFHIYLPLP